MDNGTGFTLAATTGPPVIFPARLARFGIAVDS
jgi:hypothetical protein